MASTYREYKLSYNATVESITVEMDNVSRSVNEVTVIQITPSGAKWKQVFGDGKITWAFSFDLADSSLLDVFQEAYDAGVNGYTLTLSEQNDSGLFDEYEVIINQPSYTPDSVGSDSVVRSLSVEVLEA